MNVSLSPELDQYILAKVASGRYNSASEVVREAVRLLQEQDEMKEVRLAELKRQIQKGIDDVDAGRVVQGGPEVFEGVKRRGRESLKRRQAG